MPRPALHMHGAHAVSGAPYFPHWHAQPPLLRPCPFVCPPAPRFLNPSTPAPPRTCAERGRSYLPPASKNRTSRASSHAAISSVSAMSSAKHCC